MITEEEGRNHESGSSFIMTGEGKHRGEDIEMMGLLRRIMIILPMRDRIYQNWWKKSAN